MNESKFLILTIGVCLTLLGLLVQYENMLIAGLIFSLIAGFGLKK